MTSEISKDGKAARPFVTDIEPYFFGRPVTYVDAGAHNGSVFRQLLASGFYVREAHLVEPNPRTFEALRATAEDVHNVNHVACHNIALSSAAGTVTMRDEDSMTHVVADPSHEPSDSGTFEIETTTLDDLIQRSGIGHINLLKIDVEGHELQVLEGASKALTEEAVDILYIETGLDPASEQHVLYKDVEEALQPYGYRVLRFYEQRNEWLDDSPVLRRTNIAFVSSSFAERHPYKLSRELVRLRKRNDQLSETNDELKQKNDELSTANDALQQRIDELFTEVGTLREQVSTIRSLEREREEARTAAATAAKQLAETEQQAREVEQRLTHERDEFVKYADGLQKRYVGVLQSRTWRVMAPARVAGRFVRRLRGRPAARSKMPKRPAVHDHGPSIGHGERNRPSAHP
ncbi:FkbM family methyltransferase [Haloactinopolyspora alba]|uniref:FkbM family methyltransferase n=1 Tax=Haloactinopolyspora alba TaxID=648780 RepID=A0A2P8DT50_9ACTN|nr:FkbM family methyltransferase [Haloactinopolyspora alba]PSL00394.1 FkbM family methyltransferase [Haloactinopolyspora alba]